jgi:plastocyanin
LIMLRAGVQRFVIVLTAAAVTGLCSGVIAAAVHAKPATHTIVIEAMRFEPRELTVKNGDTIVWVNHDPFPHTVTAESKQFDSHDIASGGSWKYTARKAGVFSYTCSLHPNMPGTLRVE